MMLSQWRTNMTKVWDYFLQDVNDCQVHRCKTCTIACVPSLLSWSATSNVHTDGERVQTTLQDSDIHQAEGI